MAAKANKLEPIHPGEILSEEFLKPLGISQQRLARDIDVPVTRISDIVRGKRAITADTALRLAKYFRTSPDVWLGLQIEHELYAARGGRLGQQSNTASAPWTRRDEPRYAAAIR